MTGQPATWRSSTVSTDLTRSSAVPDGRSVGRRKAEKGEFIDGDVNGIVSCTSGPNARPDQTSSTRMSIDGDPDTGSMVARPVSPHNYSGTDRAIDRRTEWRPTQKSMARPPQTAPFVGHMAGEGD
jgi:hypothetical protein